MKIYLEKKKNTEFNYVTPQEFGAVGNGTTDDTTAIQNMINEGKNILFESGKKYLITKPLILEKDNMIIDFNNSELIWNGSEPLDRNNGSERYYGALTVRGSIESWSDRKTIESIEYDATDNNLCSGMAFEVANHGYKVGEHVQVYIDTTGWATDYSDYKPILNRIGRVVKVETDKVYTDIKCPHEFKLNTVTNKMIRRVYLLENITIKNMIYKDKTPEVWTYENTSDRDSFVGGLAFHYCRNIVCENIIGHNHKFPLIQAKLSYLGKFNNIQAYDKSTSGPGLGYIMQLNYCVYMDIDHCYGENVSPVVDFSCCAYSSIRNAGSRTGLQTTNSGTTNKFTCHGIGEHDILFDNCQGHIHFGNGITEFTVLTDNIKVINCNGYLGAQCVNNLIVENSVLELGHTSFDNKLYGCNIIFRDCDIRFEEPRYNFCMLDRGHYRNKYIKFEGCNFNYLGKQINNNVIRGFTTVMINNCTFNKVSANMGSATDWCAFNIMDNYYVNFTNNITMNLGIMLNYYTSGIFTERIQATNRINITNNVFRRTITSADYGAFNAISLESEFVTVDNGWMVNIDNNIFDAKETTEQIRAIYTRNDTKPVGTNIRVTNCYFNNATDWLVDRLSNTVLMKANNIFVNYSGGLSQ